MSTVKSFSLIIPAFNEEQRLPRTLSNVGEWATKINFPIEILVMDDGSTDKTTEIVNNFSLKEDRIHLVRSKRNLGKMMQVLKGFKLAKKEIIGVMDADLAAKADEFFRLFPALSKYDIVIGSRYLRGNLSPISGKPLFARILSRGYTALFRLLFSLPVYDPQIGFKIYKRKILKNLLPIISRTDGITDTEIIVKAYGMGLKIAEIPINYHHVSAHSKIDRTGTVIPVILALISIWIETYKLYKKHKLKRLPSKGELYLKIIH
jgi:dolichyl-phosphate beta-glucosyltransferase